MYSVLYISIIIIASTLKICIKLIVILVSKYQDSTTKLLLIASPIY